MTMTQTASTTKTPPARAPRARRKPAAEGDAPARIGRPSRYEGEKEKKLLILTTDAISVANQIAARDACSFSNAVESLIRAAGAARGVHPIAKVRL